MKKSILTHPWMVFLIALLCALLWGSAFPGVKTGYEWFSVEDSLAGKLFFASFRFLLAGLSIFLFLWARGRPVLLDKASQYGVVVLLGLLQTTCQYFFFYMGLANTSGVKASILIGSGSFFMALFSHWWVPGDTLSRIKILGLCLGFSGLVLINVTKTESSSEWLVFHWQGEGLMLLTALVSAIAALLVKKHSMAIAPPLLSAYQLTFGAIVLFCIACFFGSPKELAYTEKSLCLLVYLSCVSSVAFSLWYLLIKHNNLTRVAVYRFLIPICGAILSVFFLDGETFTIFSLFALGLVSLGIILISRKL